MPEEYLARNIKKETAENYLGGWPYGADARRNLYLKYAKYPDDIAFSRQETIRQLEVRDIWQEVAGKVIQYCGNSPELIGLDVGASSGYFIRKLLESGYQGAIAGSDIETGHQPFLHSDISQDNPNTPLLFGHSDAQNLQQFKYLTDEGESSLQISNDSFDFLCELFVLYHVPDTEKAYLAAHRVLKPDGLAIFSSRGLKNQLHLWTLGKNIAQNFNTTEPESFYSAHSVDDMEDYLDKSSEFEILEKVSQADHLWIPANDDGWFDYREALMSLRPLLKERKSGKLINGKILSDYLDEVIRPTEFESQASKNDGYFIDYVFQNFYVCRANK